MVCGLCGRESVIVEVGTMVAARFFRKLLIDVYLFSTVKEGKMGIIRFLVRAVVMEGLAIGAIIWLATSSSAPADPAGRMSPNTRSLTGLLDDAVSNVGDAFTRPLPPATHRAPYVETRLKSAAGKLSGAADRLFDRAIEGFLE